jgi:hypothetical protein
MKLHLTRYEKSHNYKYIQDCEVRLKTKLLESE